MKQAVILAGGRGRRLEPYTTVLPKPLMPVGDMSILEIVIRQLVHSGFADITLAVGYLSELIMAFCGDGSRWRARIRYSLEEKPLGTAGPLALIEGLDEPFLLMNGDVLTTLDYEAVYQYHLEGDALITIATHKRHVQINLGVVELDSDGWLSAYIEKPTFDYRVSMGIYVVDPSVLAAITPGTYLDLPDLVRSTIPQRKVRAYKFDGYWQDIGNPNDYEAVLDDFERMRAMLVPGAPPPADASDSKLPDRL